MMGYNAPLRTLTYAPATFRPLIARMTLSPGAGPSIPSRAKSTIATLLTDSPIKTSFPTPSTSTRLSNSRPAAILPLPRPLGVPKPPSSAPETWSQLTDKLLDEDRHNAKRKALYIPPHFLGLYRADGGARLKEAKQGYFHDYNQARKELGAKLWNAPPVLIREDVGHLLSWPGLS